MANTTIVVPNFVTQDPSGNVTSTGQFFGANGTAAAPSFAFTNAAGTGMYRPSANALGFSTNGTLALTISSAQVATFAGNVILPAAGSLSWTGLAQLTSPANGQLQLQNNAGGITAGTSGFMLGAATSANVMFTQQTGVAARAATRLADNSGYAAIISQSFLSNGSTALQTPSGTQDISFGDIFNGIQFHTASGTLAATFDSTQVMRLFGTGGYQGGGTASSVNFRSVSALTTLNLGGATTTLVQIPAGALVLAVTARVTTTITAAVSTSWSIGTGAIPTDWGTGLAFAAGTTVSGANYVTTTPQIFPAATNVVCTMNVDTATAGAIRTVVYYIDVTPPTS